MRTTNTIAFASVSLLAMAAPAFGQDRAPAEEGVSSNSEIVVTARRKDEKLQDVPMVVQAVSSEQINKLEIRQFEDLTRVVPGLNMAQGAGGIGTSSSIRGVNFDSRASGSYNTVEFYRNDAVISAGALFQAVYDIGQVEVLRGPQGTLRGRATPSGSITVTTHRPNLSEIGGYLNAAAANRGKWELNGAINVPIIKDKLAIRIAGFNGENRGNNVYGLNVVNGAVTRDIYVRNRAIRASVRADPFDGVLVLDFNYESVRSKNSQFNQVESFKLLDSVKALATTAPTITPVNRLGVTAVPNLSDQSYKIYNWQAALKLFGQKLTYVGNQLNGVVNAFASQDNAGVLPTILSPTAPNYNFAQETLSINKQTTHEIRLQNEDRIAGLFDYVVGYMNIKANTPSLQNGSGVTGIVTAPAATPTYPNYTLTNVTNTLGVFRFRQNEESSFFGNLTLHAGDKAELSGGVRQISFKEFSGVATGAWPTGGIPANGLPTVVATGALYASGVANFRCFGNGNRDLTAYVAAGTPCNPVKKATIYSVNGKYKITPDIMLYASYGTSYRPGNSLIGWRGTTVGPFLSNFLNLPDEKSNSLEFGFKSSFFDRKMHLNFSYYIQKFTNYPFYLTSPVAALSTPNDPAVDATTSVATAFSFAAPTNAKVNGFEAEWGWDVSRNFNLAATLSYANGQIKGGVFPCLDVNGDGVPDTTTPTAAAYYAVTKGNQVNTCKTDTPSTSAPKWSGTVSAEYSHDISDNLQGFVRGFLAWKGYTEGFRLNPYDQVKGYALLDMYLGVKGNKGAWDLTFYAKNLLNTKRVLTAFDAPQVTSMTLNNVARQSKSDTQYTQITTLDPREFGISATFRFGSR